jgi:hypothetical protein
MTVNLPAHLHGLCTARAQFEDSATDQQRAVVLAVAMIHLLLDGYSAITLACVWVPRVPTTHCVPPGGEGEVLGVAGVMVDRLCHTGAHTRRHNDRKGRSGVIILCVLPAVFDPYQSQISTRNVNTRLIRTAPGQCVPVDAPCIHRKTKQQCTTTHLCPFVQSRCSL